MDPSGPPREDESQEIRPSGGEAQQPLQSVPPAPPSQLTRFQSLPLEIQMAIFKEALRKPSVQFLMVEKQISQQRNWDVKITPVPKRSDPSGYRYLEGLKTVCDAAKAAVRWATIESKSIQFRHLPNTVDTATDLFVMEFRRYRDQPWEVMRLRDCFWNPLHEVIRPFLHRGNVRRKFHGMCRAGVTYKYSHTSSSYLHATVPFKCLLGHTANNGSCLTSYKICPVELAGFIDCLPDLETFYIIMFVVDFQRSLIDADIPGMLPRAAQL